MKTIGQNQNMLPITHLQQNNPQQHPQPLSSKTQVQLQHNQIAQRLTSTALGNIQGEIMHSKITVSETSEKHLALDKRIDEEQLQLHQIVRRRKELNDEITRLKYQESKVKDINRKNIISRKTKSDFTRQQHQSIIKLLQSQRKLQEESALKTKKLHESIRAQQLNEQVSHRQRMQEQRRQKQSQIVENLKELQMKQQNRQKEIKSLNKVYQSVKGSPVLHQKMERKWKEREMDNQFASKDFLSLRKKSKEFSMKIILEHQQKYKTFITNHSKSTKQKIRQIKQQQKVIEQSTLTQYQPSKFLTSVIEEEARLKQLQMQKGQLIKHLVNTKSNYGKQIRELHRQNLKKKLPPINQGQEDDYRRLSKSLNREELAQLGNRYLREVHSSIGEIQIKPSPPKQHQQNMPIKYQDYLQDLKKQRKEKQVSNPQIREIRELQTVLNKKTNDSEKLYLAKVIANKLHERTKSNDASMLLASINAKMAIINKFTL